MKITRIIPFLVLLAASLGWFWGPAFAATADEDWAAVQKLLRENPPGDPHDMPKRDHARWSDGQAQRVAQAGWAFYSTHPQDPRRWDIAYRMTRLRPRFITEFAPDYDTTGKVSVDEAATVAWQQRVSDLTAAIAAATDLPACVSVQLEGEKISKAVQDLARLDPVARSTALPGLGQEIAAYAARYPDQPAVTMYAISYLFAAESVSTTDLERALGGLASNPHSALAKVAGDRLRALALLKHPFAMKFTAVDGREVDVAALKGKVVLVDFWATWCVPCVAELPNVKKVYADYQAQGFEVVAISLEISGLTPQDTPEQAAAKLEKAKKKLTDFTAKEDMPWPQYFDGLGWKNKFSQQHAIQGIPAMFLIDQNGMIVSTNARGDKLEAEVKRLLKL
jgi:thiol-disulfide isomerase/thioredoxin